MAINRRCTKANEFYKEQKTLMQEALQQRIEEKEKALRIARKVARETAERRDKQNVITEAAGPDSAVRMGRLRISLISITPPSPLMIIRGTVTPAARTDADHLSQRDKSG